MTKNALRHSILPAPVMLAVSMLLAVSPAVSAPAQKPGSHPENHGPTSVWIEDRNAEKQVFSGHDGHIGPPTAEDWARYQAAEAKRIAETPLIPCPVRQDRHRRHKR